MLAELKYIFDEIKKNKEEIDKSINHFESIIEMIKETETKIKLYDEITKRNDNEFSNIKALAIFKNINEFNKANENLYMVKDWKIYNQDSKTRIDFLKEKSYFCILKDTFESKINLNKKCSNEQILSFLDTISIMYKILNSLEQSIIEKDIYIISEYEIPSKEKNRIDYLLAYGDKLILIEFSKISEEENISKIDKSKKEQVNNYKSQLVETLNIDPMNIKTNTVIYTAIGINKKEDITEQNIQNVIKTINNTFKNYKTAIDILKEKN